MSRVEENEKFVKKFFDTINKSPNPLTWYVGAISGTLVDISKSLAMIADKMASPTGAERSTE